jgi:hypothetical protein
VIVEPASGTPDERSYISTPDRRVRVFVSWTLQELAAERAAARAAITGLHLAPVMFELGARPPHPAREFGFLGVASVAGVVRLLPAWPYCLLAFPALFRVSPG